jgi:putative flippase GtrA
VNQEDWMNLKYADMAQMMSETSPQPRSVLHLLKRAFQSWATRSLAVGAVATMLDVAVLLVCVKVIGMPNPAGAMVGVLFGSTFTFFANRHFAFRDHNPKLAPQAAKFAMATAVGMIAHAQIVYMLADRMGIPVVLAKLGADVVVFTVGQMLLLRYFVFPKKSAAKDAAAEQATSALAMDEVSADRAA